MNIDAISSDKIQEQNPQTKKQSDGEEKTSFSEEYQIFLMPLQVSEPLFCIKKKPALWAYGNKVLSISKFSCLRWHWGDRSCGVRVTNLRFVYLFLEKREKAVCVYVYSSVALHSFRKHSFHVSAVKAKLPEPHFSVCSIALKWGNQY